LRKLKIYKLLIPVVLGILIWIIALIAGFPVIPCRVTSFSVKSTATDLAQGLNIKNFQIKIPLEFEDTCKAIDLWLDTSFKNEMEIITYDINIVDKDLLPVRDKGVYVFSQKPTNAGNTKILRFPKIGKVAYYTSQILFIRCIFDFSNSSQFQVNLTCHYREDGEMKLLEKSFNIIKSQKITWSKFKVH
jgi:hypothetical protein